MRGSTNETEKLRLTIQEFLSERLAGKVEKLAEDDPKHEALVAQFDYEHWLADAARRVAQLQVVTHSLKPIHPDAKGSSVYAPPGAPRPGAVVGTDLLGDQFTVDVVGNAAALDVFKFLKIDVDGRTLLERVEQSDPDLEAALSDDPQTGRERMQQFATITEPGGRYASHTRGKQLFWLVGDDPAVNDDFHLLAPLYATSLAHRVFQTINRDRFSDEAKAARDARRKDQPSETGYCDYPGLAVQRFGGSKPQNISQLNSERGGNSYLLGSAPPLWRSRAVAPIRSPSAFNAYGRRRNVRATIRELGTFLAEDPTRNMHTRDYRDQLTAELVDELIVFTSEMRQLPPGWTDDWQCRLPIEQQCWLDPHRAEMDREFAETLVETEWLPEMCQDFSRWLNARLDRHRNLHMGDAEHRHFASAAGNDTNIRNALESARKDWQAQLEKELAALAEVFDDE
ncbi:type I-F CRISPR-associated protein Csy1 [Salinisphaera orenii]|uniref:CRISPR-associated protein Csy1 n=1 Tax=Salinisphaera orenii YIM 95161 TaxID=1051139 RepID=A0A423PZ44_9GAMM|nr:type I-F CRISPR-associated protein Csy1 [Salinisphaera halophila]ROO30783.1 CRISPR-associated protein Csy1 [Salinisphaera halophila YIM 95161]